jgi:putative PIN family toxin of toxin-antitoxin system
VGKKIKVVFDTNVWISITMRKIVKDQYLKTKDNLTLYISKDIILETSKVLQYPKINQVLKEANISQRDALRTITAQSKIVEPKIDQHIIDEDKQDNKILECAQAANADYIVSGDKHLLQLGKFKKTRILTPREFFDNFP